MITWLVSVILACIPKRLELVPSNSLGQYFRAMVTLLHGKELGAAPDKGLFGPTSQLATQRFILSQLLSLLRIFQFDHLVGFGNILA